MTRNAPIRTFSRTIAVRFFRDSRTRKFVSARILKKHGEKSVHQLKITFVFLHLTPAAHFFSDSQLKIALSGTFSARLLLQVIETHPHLRRVHNRQQKSNESPYAKYIFS